LLGGATLEQVAPCADFIRRGSGADCAGIQLDAEPQSRPWHFIDIPISDSPESLEPYCPGGNCVVDQIKDDVRALEDSSASFSQRQLALIYLVHFVGDEHQPLHCADEIVDGRSDYGGNAKPVVFEGSRSQRLNLHALWDHIIEPKDKLDPSTLAAQLERDIKKRDISSWTSGDFVADAARESFQIAKDDIYPEYAADGGRIDASYHDRMQALAELRLEKAGVRLSALIETALGGQGPESSQRLAQASGLPAGGAAIGRRVDAMVRQAAWSRQ
ncbi:MAG: hypothetical protein KGK30_03185, partial [Elusimicrobia bacterium]|nr:hypothetical protein [Elusimicrobiota bacterium]